MMVASKVVFPTPLRPMIDTVSLDTERETNILKHHRLAVASADVVELKRTVTVCLNHGGLRGGLPVRDRPPSPARYS